MDSLKTLLDQKKYDLIIKLTETSQTANDLFYRISAFICLGKYEEALYVIQDNQKTLESNLASLINAHINLLCALNRFDQAYTTLDYYANLPYQSQVVEELLQKMPQVIEAEEKKSSSLKFYDDDTISKLLSSDKDEEVLMALDIIKNRDIFSFLPEVSKLLLSHPKEIIKSYALMLLVQKELDRKLQINKNGKIITVVPKYLTPPFTGVIFNQVVKYFDSEFHDLTITQTATQLLSQYCIYIYPNFLDKSPKLYAVAFYLIASKYAGASLNEEQRSALISKTEVNADELDELIKEIETSLADF